MQPQIKPEHFPIRVRDGKVRIGGVSFGLAAEIEDPSGSVWLLVEAMDGSRTVDEVVAYVRERHPWETDDAIVEGITVLAESGYLEDAGAPDPRELTARDKERHDRGRRYYRWVDLTDRGSSWSPQVAMKQARVTVVGVGGTGGIAALALAASGVGELRCVDRDVVELSNLNRQVLYAEADVGTSKVAAAVGRLRALNSDIEVTGERREVRGVSDLEELAAGCDVLLVTADQPPELRMWANAACLSTSTPWVNAGYHGPLVTVGTFVPGKGACSQCLRLAMDEDWRNAGIDPADTHLRSQAVGNAVGAAPAGISGYLAAHAVTSLITGVPPARPGTIHAVNLVALDAPFVRDDPPRSDCPACGGNGGGNGGGGSGGNGDGGGG